VFLINGYNFIVPGKLMKYFLLSNYITRKKAQCFPFQVEFTNI